MTLPNLLVSSAFKPPRILLFQFLAKIFGDISKCVFYTVIGLDIY